uniref:Putative LOV domain-containing protein n=1 Tax=Spirotaenia minuta TaxID=1408785 RepID=A0A126X0X1_9VIRI|nr:putative LOV domain-containing protein [Spirotaenia minuta]
MAQLAMRDFTTDVGIPAVAPSFGRSLAPRTPPVGDDSGAVLREPGSSMGDNAGRGDSTDNEVRKEFDEIRGMLSELDHTFCISDPRLPDLPVVFASPNFFKLTGYSPNEVLGKNCRFLQGPLTERRAVLEIRDAIREERACQVRLLNYKKDGSPFYNLFHMAPVFEHSADGTATIVRHYVGVQTDLTPLLLRVGVEKAAMAFEAIDTHSCTTALTTRWNWDESPTVAELGRQLEECGIQISSSPPQPPSELADRISVEAVSTGREVARRLSMSASRPVEEPNISSSLLLALSRIQQSFVLCDPAIPDCPIVHASDVFIRQWGYPREFVIGRNCRFLQGPDTDPNTVAAIRHAIESSVPITCKLLNYTIDGKPLWNHLHIAPVRGANGKVAFFIGLQLDITNFLPEGADILHTVPVVPDVNRLKQLGAVGQVRVAVRALSKCPSQQPALQTLCRHSSSQAPFTGGTSGVGVPCNTCSPGGAVDGLKRTITG